MCPFNGEHEREALKFSLQVLGKITLHREGFEVPLSGVMRRVVAYVALYGQSQRAIVAGRLWPDSGEAKAHASLRNALWQLNSRVQGLLFVSASCIEFSRETSVDLHRFTNASNSISEDPRDPYDAFFMGGELLPGMYEDWIESERELLRQQCLHTLENNSALLLEQGRYADALELALKAVQIEPLRESSNAAVVAVHLCERNFVEALRHYETFKAQLWDVLGVTPSREFEQSIPSIPPSPRSARSR
jgi:DNA-binding SARP family transcriptional activator